MEQSILQHYIDLASKSDKASIDEIMGHLNMDMTIPESKIIDFALSHVEGEEGLRVMEHYLFHGTQVQRNYVTLYFARRGEYLLIRKAYDMGLVDALQAFSR